MRYYTYPKSNNGSLYIDDKLNHISVCGGGLFCTQCGRRGCIGCITQDSDTNRCYNPQSIGKCTVCNGLLQEDKILLYPKSNKEWDLEENY